MTAPTIYRSDDTGAPELVGTTNSSFINLLKDCLVNGYGTKPAAGWTVAFDDPTNHKAVFRQGGGNQRYLRVVDDGTSNDSTSGRARIVGYGSMTDIDTGSDPFPTDTQVSGGLYAHTSQFEDTDPRTWWMVATDKFFVLMVDARYENGIGESTYEAFIAFGDIESFRASDEWNTLIFGTPTGSDNDVKHFGEFNQSTGFYLARDSGNTEPTPCYFEDNSVYDLSTFHSGSLAYPDPVTGKMLLSQVAVVESNGDLLRGRLPGIWATPHSGSNFTKFDTFQGSDDISEKEFQLLPFDGSPVMIIETNGGWL